MPRKGRSGRKRKYESHPLVDRARKYSLAYYYKHKEERNKATQEYHKRIKDYADKHGITFTEALKRGAGKQKKSEQK